MGIPWNSTGTRPVCMTHHCLFMCSIYSIRRCPWICHGLHKSCRLFDMSLQVFPVYEPRVRHVQELRCSGACLQTWPVPEARKHKQRLQSCAVLSTSRVTDSQLPLAAKGEGEGRSFSRSCSRASDAAYQLARGPRRGLAMLGVALAETRRLQVRRACLAGNPLK